MERPLFPHFSRTIFPTRMEVRSGTGRFAGFAASLELIAPAGRIVLFGNAGGGEFAPLPPLGHLIGGNISIGGFNIRRLAEAAPERLA